MGLNQQAGRIASFGKSSSGIEQAFESTTAFGLPIEHVGKFGLEGGQFLVTESRRGKNVRSPSYQYHHLCLFYSLDLDVD
jgi:hypothetical protein